MVYPFDEMATVHEGSVKLTDVKTGVTVEYHKGDTWFAAKGTEVLWEIDVPRFKTLPSLCKCLISFY